MNIEANKFSLRDDTLNCFDLNVEYTYFMLGFVRNMKIINVNKLALYYRIQSAVLPSFTKFVLGKIKKN